MLTTRSVSRFIHRWAFRRKRGTTYTPTTNQRMRKKASFSRLPARAMPSNWRLTATALSTTMSRMPRMSSRMSTLSTSPENFFCRRPRSSKAL